MSARQPCPPAPGPLEAFAAQFDSLFGSLGQRRSFGKIDNGIVAVTTLWADGRVHYPLHFAPYTPASRFAAGAKDPRFRTKPQIALELIEQARAADIPFRAVVIDCFYGDNPPRARGAAHAAQDPPCPGPSRRLEPRVGTGRGDPFLCGGGPGPAPRRMEADPTALP